MDHTKIYTKDLDSPRQELSNRVLEIVVAITVFFGDWFFAGLYWASNPAVEDSIASMYNYPGYEMVPSSVGSSWK